MGKGRPRRTDAEKAAALFFHAHGPARERKRRAHDVLRDWIGRSLRERGALEFLLDYYRASGLPLPNDMQSAYRIARADARSDRAAVRAVIVRDFVVGADGRLHHAATDAELERARKRREAAKRSARGQGGRVGEAANYQDFDAKPTAPEPKAATSLWRDVQRLRRGKSAT